MPCRSMLLSPPDNRSSVTSPSATQKVSARAASRTHRARHRQIPNVCGRHICARSMETAMSAPVRGGKLRAYLQFVAAVLYFFVARSFARGAAVRIHRDAFEPLVEQFLLAAILILGYAAFGSLFDRQTNSIAAQGLPLRSGWTREIGVGMAIGWGAVIVCVLAMVVIGGIAVVVTLQPSAWPWLIAD